MEATTAAKFWSFIICSFGAITSAFLAEGDSEIGFLTAERQRRRKLRGLRRDVSALVLQIVGDGTAKRGVGDIMRGIGRDGSVAAQDLVGALRARLDHLQAALDRVFDRLVIANLEMQERPVLDRAPIAAVDRVATEEIERAGDELPPALRPHQHD